MAITYVLTQGPRNSIFSGEAAKKNQSIWFFSGREKLVFSLVSLWISGEAAASLASPVPRPLEIIEIFLLKEYYKTWKFSWEKLIYYILRNFTFLYVPIFYIRHFLSKHTHKKVWKWKWQHREITLSPTLQYWTDSKVWSLSIL